MPGSHYTHGTFWVLTLVRPPMRLAPPPQMANKRTGINLVSLISKKVVSGSSEIFLVWSNQWCCQQCTQRSCNQTSNIATTGSLKIFIKHVLFHVCILFSNSIFRHTGYVTILVCGRSGLWSLWVESISVCGCFGIGTFMLSKMYGDYNQKHICSFPIS